MRLKVDRFISEVVPLMRQKGGWNPEMFTDCYKADGGLCDRTLFVHVARDVTRRTIPLLLPSSFVQGKIHVSSSMANPNTRTPVCYKCNRPVCSIHTTLKDPIHFRKIGFRRAILLHYPWSCNQSGFCAGSYSR